MMAAEIKLKRGDAVRRSIAGARGFFYPDIAGRQIVIQKDCIAEIHVGWHERNDHIACQVPTDAFAVGDQYGPAQIMVVWVVKNG
jgi:hypothetical protein